MQYSEVERRLEETPMFAGLAHAHLSALASHAVELRLPAGAELFRAGEPAARFFLILEGTVALEIEAPGSRRLVIETLHEGDIAGWSWLFAPRLWQFDGRARGPVELLAFDGAAVLAECTADHELGYELMGRFAGVMLERLQATRLQLTDVYGHGRTG